jgi:hypothetical protein
MSLVPALGRSEAGDDRLIYIGLDDTDSQHSVGTGHLARRLALDLARSYTVDGITRHQLLRDDRIAYTKRNSSAAILMRGSGEALESLQMLVRKRVRSASDPDSDPGVCVGLTVTEVVMAFGRRAQQELLSVGEALELARSAGLDLAGLGGDGSGVIGALAAVGLAATGEDGRYVQVGSVRDLNGMRTVEQVLAAGVAEVRSQDGEQVSEGWIRAEKVRPARRAGKPVLIVGEGDGYWIPLKLN